MFILAYPAHLPLRHTRALHSLHTLPVGAKLERLPVKDVLWSNPRAELTVESGGGRELGNCYSASTYVVTALHPLDAEQINALRNAGFLGYGQEFHIRGQQVDGQMAPVPAKLDWQTRPKIKPSGMDKVAARVRDRATGNWLDEPPVNQYTGQPTPDQDMPYFVYVVESRVDSSD